MGSCRSLQHLFPGQLAGAPAGAEDASRRPGHGDKKVTGSRSLPSPGWRRVAAFGVDYAIILVYLGVLTLVGLLGRGVGVVPDDVTTPAGRVLAQLVVFAVLTVPVTGWFAGWEGALEERRPASGSLGSGSSPLAVTGWPGRARCCGRR